MAQTDILMTIGLAAATLLLSAAGVWLSIRLTIRAGVMDVPNERSSHSVPTPRMGGVPMAGAAAIGLSCWCALAHDGPPPGAPLVSCVLFALSMSALGLWDDLASLSPLFRFVIQAVGATAVSGVAAAAGIAIRIGPIEVPVWAWLPVSVLWIVWMLNLYNFMDGIDGLAGGEALLASAFFAVVFAHHGEPVWSAANLFIAAAAAGFLFFNWHPARVFMGDGGSAFLGAFYGVQSVAAGLGTAVPFLVLVLPFSNFILDTTLTLFRRALAGEKWYRPHRTHWYQKMTDRGYSHAEVVIIEMAAMLISIMLSAWILLGDRP